MWGKKCSGVVYNISIYNSLYTYISLNQTYPCPNNPSILIDSIYLIYLWGSVGMLGVQLFDL